MPNPLYRDPTTNLDADFPTGQYFAPPGYIDGLQMVWNSSASISVMSGAAYIPALGYALSLPSEITLSGLTLAASTFYHLYLYDNSGTPAVECVTTAPVNYYGTAWEKNGDSSRRYIGSVLLTASNTIAPFAQNGNLMMYAGNLIAAPFLVLSGGMETAATTVSCAGVIPITGTHAQMLAVNNTTTPGMAIGAVGFGYTLSASSYNQYIAAGDYIAFTLPLAVGLQTFQYLFSAAPSSGGGSIRVNGYTFER